MNNLVILYMEILRGFQTDIPVKVAFLDIKAAYDNVIDILINRLTNLSIPSMCRFIYNLVSARQVCRYGEIQEIFRLFKGLPQGSILSLMLYAIYVAELEVNSQECKIIQYTDNVCIFSAMDSVEESLNRVESAVDKIFTSLNNLGLSLSAKKTKL